MFKIKLAAFAAMTLALAAVGASAQQATQAGLGAALPDGKIAVVNTQAFPQGIGELKQKYDAVEKQFQPRYQQLQAMETQLKQMESDIQVKCPQLTADKCQELQRNYEDLKKKATRDYEDAKADYDRTIDAQTKPVRDKLFQFLNTYAAQRGIVLVINLAGAARPASQRKDWCNQHLGLSGAGFRVQRQDRRFEPAIRSASERSSGTGRQD